MNLEKMAQNIKILREEKGLTQSELAEIVMSSRSTVAKWENNSALPDIISLIKLSSFFNISIDNLVGKQSFQNELLKEFKRLYGSDHTFDEELFELTEYLMINPQLKRHIYQLKKLPLTKQESIHRLVKHVIDEYNTI